MPEPSLVELVDVSKTFANGLTAVEGLRLQLARGEFTCFVGPSGCGKSTVLRLLAGLTSASVGEVRRDLADSPNDAAGDVGFVFQEPTLLPWSRVWDNVYLPLRLKGYSKTAATDQVNEALQMVGLEEFARAYPRELSGGMKMRVSIARALVTRPELLLMDEPFAALDELTRFALNDQLLELWHQHQWTIAFVTHSVYEAAFLAQRVVVMSPRPGRIVADIRVDAAYPREPDFRRSEVYLNACEQVSAALARSTGVALA